jgi:molybdopterin converting factor small subunit
MRFESATIEVRVLLFAAYRETMGRSEIRLEMPACSGLEDLYRVLTLEEPRMARLRPYTTFAVNREVVAADTVLEDGDEVALLQPASGGCND